MKIHTSRDGKQFGPYTLAEVNGHLSTGHLKPEDLAWHEGLADWQPLSSIQGVNALTPAQRAPSPPPPKSVPSDATTNTQTQPKTHLFEAICVTLLCCPPFGIVAIFFASQVNSKWAAGDQAGALAASKMAKLWTNLTMLALPLAFLILSLIIGLFSSGR